MWSERITISKGETHCPSHMHMKEIHAACSGCLATNVQVIKLHKGDDETPKVRTLEVFANNMIHLTADTEHDCVNLLSDRLEKRYFFSYLILRWEVNFVFPYLLPAKRRAVKRAIYHGHRNFITWRLWPYLQIVCQVMTSLRYNQRELA